MDGHQPGKFRLNSIHPKMPLEEALKRLFGETELSFWIEDLLTENEMKNK